MDFKVFIPTELIPRSGHSNRWPLTEMLLKCTYISEKNNTARSPFTRVDNKARWGKQSLQLYGKDPESMLRASKAIVKKVPGLMKGYDIAQMGIDDTRLGDWNANWSNMEDHRRSEVRAPAGEDRRQGG